jgi:hypothetical protein
MKTTVWHKFQCPGGNRWTSTLTPGTSDPTGQKCEFSGCNCNGIVTYEGQTIELNDAHKWFRQPHGKKGQFLCYA